MPSGKRSLFLWGRFGKSYGVYICENLPVVVKRRSRCRGPVRGGVDPV